jgi:hypothetical protein
LDENDYKLACVILPSPLTFQAILLNMQAWGKLIFGSIRLAMSRKKKIGDSL